METYIKYEDGASGESYHVMVDWTSGGCEVVDIRQDDNGDVVGKNLVNVLSEDFIYSVEIFAEQYLSQYEN